MAKTIDILLFALTGEFSQAKFQIEISERAQQITFPRMGREILKLCKVKLWSISTQYLNNEYLTATMFMTQSHFIKFNDRYDSVLLFWN